MIGVPVISMVSGISPRLLSTAWKGGASVRDVTRAPVTPPRTRIMFWSETVISGSCADPGVNQRFGVEHPRIVVSVLPRNRE
jgi:hypothetical protein